jgi:ribose/xylose/arabinose/galactoside ABC-type transport system permease subunit
MILSPKAFARPANLINILKQASINGILAAGMMYVIISGGIDLSVGSIVALSGVIAAVLLIRVNIP